MKKVIIILFACLLVCGCGKEKSQDKSKVSKEHKKDKTTITEKITTTKEESTTQKPSTTTKIKNSTAKANVPQSNDTIQTKASTTTTRSCVAKKFSNKYTYAYSSFDECKTRGNDAFLNITESGNNSIFSYGCDTIVDDCGTTWYGVFFYQYNGSEVEKFYY